jgi:ferredoxin
MENFMANITAAGQTFTAEDGTRLVNAIEDAGIDILHRCGGFARCTTCRVTFNSGEPETYHPRERAKLESGGKLGEFRLSCHILCEGDMDVNPLMRLSEMDGMDDAGPRVADEIPE